MNKQKWTRLIITILIIVGVVLAIYLPLKLTGAIDKINSIEKMRLFVLSGGVYSYILFAALQFLQVTFLPIPAIVTTVAGTLIFGPWIALLISFIAVMLGSLFAFFLGKKIGRRLIIWNIGEEKTAKLEAMVGRGKYVYFLMMLFPFFPDDILCMVVGSVNMKFSYFLWVNLITRPIVLACTCFFGSGQIIPFSGWGTPVWIVLILLGITAMVLSLKYQPQIENWVTKIGTKISRKRRKYILKNKIKKYKKQQETKKFLNACILISHLLIQRKL